MKKLFTLALASCLVVCAGCVQQGVEAESQEEIVYADQEAVGALGQGLEKRFDLADTYDETTAETLAEIVSTEVDQLAPFRNRQFEDPKLQEKILIYLNLLEETKELSKDFGVNDDVFYDEWDSLYDERASMLKDFVDNYGLSVDEEHQEALDDLIRRGQSVEKAEAEKDAIEGLVASLDFEKTSDEDGWFFTYAAVGENTTELDFENVSLVLALYDDDGIKVEESYAGVNSWLRGEKVKFETVSEVDAAEVKVSLEFYSVGD